MAEGRPTPVVYLAGPIANVSMDEARMWRKEAARLLYRYRCAVFNPAAAWSVPIRDAGGMDETLIADVVQPVDDLALRCASGVLVQVTGVESLGTDHEIELIWQHRIPTVIYQSGPCDIGEWAADRGVDLEETAVAAHLPTACFLVALAVGAIDGRRMMEVYTNQLINAAAMRLIRAYAEGIVEAQPRWCLDHGLSGRMRRG